MKKSARRKTDATQRHRISLVACRIFCGKLLSCPATAPMPTGLSTESRAAAASAPRSVVTPRADKAAMHATTIHVSSRRSRGRRHPQKPKDPPGGTTGRVKLYGRWGGWALAPYTALSGRDNRSHLHWSPQAPGRSKRAANIFKLLVRSTADEKRAVTA